MSIEFLVSRQNRDGGWSYVRGASWTEPTVYAILALLAAGESDAADRGLAWVRAHQLPDGGWPPQTGFDESTWATAVVALLPPEKIGRAVHARAIRWLLRTEGEETCTAYRLREWLLGHPRMPENEFPGWPWTRGAAAWVGPTSLALIALDRAMRRTPSAELRERIEQGHKFLLRRMCADGGWNHGSVRALGYESTPYPETTGMALAALRGVRAPQLAKAIAVAQRFLVECRSADAYNWLRLGLMAHNALPQGYVPPARITYRTLTETSVGMVVAGMQKGQAGLLG